MYIGQVWDKISPINGVASDVVLNNNISYRQGGVVLFINEASQRVEIIAIESELRSDYNSPSGSIEELMTLRLDALNSDKPSSLDEVYKIMVDTKNKISILHQENADLLLDSAMKDLRIQTTENDIADLTLEIAMVGGK